MDPKPSAVKLIENIKNDDFGKWYLNIDPKRNVPTGDDGMLLLFEAYSVGFATGATVIKMVAEKEKELVLRSGVN